MNASPSPAGVTALAASPFPASDVAANVAASETDATNARVPVTRRLSAIPCLIRGYRPSWIWPDALAAPGDGRLTVQVLGAHPARDAARPPDRAPRDSESGDLRPFAALKQDPVREACYRC